MKTTLIALMLLNAVTLLALNAQASSTTNMGVGHSTTFTEISEGEIPDYLEDDLKVRINNVYTNRRKVLKTHDFNGDKVPDRVVCHIMNGTDNGVEIFDGVTGNLYYSWQVPDYSSGGVVRQFRSCSIAEIKPGRPAIFFAGARAGPSGMRYNEYQWFLYRNDNGGMSLATVKKPDGSSYVAAARSVKCTDFPKALVRAGYSHGALCFYAAYDSNLSGGRYGTYTALVKVEYRNGALTYKDLTASSGLIWVGGTYGTSMGHPNIMWTQGLSNNLSMMDAAFLDYNRDGYTDLITGGAHSYMYAFTMVRDPYRAEGLRFTKTNLGYSYIYRLQAFNETEKHLDSTCLYVGDSYYSGTPGRQNYIKCFRNGRWMNFILPGGSLHAGETFVNILTNGMGKLIIHVPTASNSSRPKFYSTNFWDDELTINARVVDRGNRIHIVGYVCRKNHHDLPIKIRVTSTRHSNHRNYKVYKNDFTSTRNLPARQQPRCLAKKASTGLINIRIFKSDLIATSGTLYIHTDIHGKISKVKALKYGQ